MPPPPIAVPNGDPLLLPSEAFGIECEVRGIPRICGRESANRQQLAAIMALEDAKRAERPRGLHSVQTPISEMLSCQVALQNLAHQLLTASKTADAKQHATIRSITAHYARRVERLVSNVAPHPDLEMVVRHMTQVLMDVHKLGESETVSAIGDEDGAVGGTNVENAPVTASPGTDEQLEVTQTTTSAHTRPSAMLSASAAPYQPTGTIPKAQRPPNQQRRRIRSSMPSISTRHATRIHIQSQSTLRATAETTRDMTGSDAIANGSASMATCTKL